MLTIPATYPTDIVTPLPFPIVPGNVMALGVIEYNRDEYRMALTNTMTIGLAKVKGVHPQDDVSWRDVRHSAKMFALVMIALGMGGEK